MQSYGPYLQATSEVNQVEAANLTAYATAAAKALAAVRTDERCMFVFSPTRREMARRRHNSGAHKRRCTPSSREMPTPTTGANHFRLCFLMEKTKRYYHTAYDPDITKLMNGPIRKQLVRPRCQP